MANLSLTVFFFIISFRLFLSSLFFLFFSFSLHFARVCQRQCDYGWKLGVVAHRESFEAWRSRRYMYVYHLRKFNLVAWQGIDPDQSRGNTPVMGVVHRHIVSSVYRVYRWISMFFRSSRQAFYSFVYSSIKLIRPHTCTSLYPCWIKFT